LVGLFGRGISPSQGRYLTQTQNKQRHPYFEWGKTSTALYESLNALTCWRVSMTKYRKAKRGKKFSSSKNFTLSLNRSDCTYFTHTHTLNDKIASCLVINTILFFSKCSDQSTRFYNMWLL
jgi:hypothetical protein